MAIVVKDRVKQNASAPGTGTITLTTTPTGFQAFSAIGNANVTYFAIVDPVSGDWEVNYGTYTASGTTLTRNATPLSSSAAGALVNFTGTTLDVFCTYPSEKAIYEETTGNVLIDGGPITVIGDNVTTYTTFSAALGEMYANINSFAQFYAQNLNNGSSASTDIVAYNDEGDGSVNFIDMGISSSNYSDALYPIFTPSSGYLYNDGGELIIGSATDDVVFFAGGVDTTDEAVRINKTTKNVSTVADVDVGGDLNATGGTFTAAVTTTASMVSPAATEFVTRSYVDEATSNGFHVHTPVLVATTGNLTATYSNGSSGVGATLTNSGAQAALSVDGVSLSVNDRVLVWQQTTGLQNGVYVVTTVGSGATNWVLTRSSDADTSSEGDPNSLGGGDYFFVQSGTTQGYFAFICTNTSAIVFGTTAITFNEFSQVPIYTGTAPINVSGQTIALTGTVAATNGGTGTATVTTGDLLYGSGTNTWGKLAAGAGYKSLVMNSGGTNVEWNAVALNQSAAVSGALGATNGGTGLNSYTLGDTIYSSAANTLAKLAGNTTTTKKFMVQTGTGSVSAAPTWDVVNGADVNGNISGSAGSVANALTAGTYLTSAGTFDGSAARTFAVDATSANTASKVVARDASGNFSAGTITATLSGAATSATTATNIAGGAANQIPYQTGSGTTSFITAPTTGSTFLSWNGSSFAYTAISTPSAVTFNSSGSGDASGTSFNGSTARTISYNTVGAPSTGGTGASGTWNISISGNAATATSASSSSTATYATTAGSVTGQANSATITATSANTGSQIVLRDSSGNFSAGTITASLSGNATTSSSTTGNAATATLATKASTLAQNGGNGAAMTFNWSGQSGQPTWLWGSNDGTNVYVYNPSNFSVNYATSSGSSSSSTYATSAGSITGQANSATITATSSNTGSQIVLRDSSGNFSAGTITASLSGNATSANNATTAGGLAVASGRNDQANQIVRTNASGYADFGWINTTSGTASGTPARVYCSEDAYIRYYSMSTFTGYVQAAASGTWGINVSGSSASCSGNAATSSNTSSISNAVGNGYTWTGVQLFQANQNTASGSNPPLQAYSSGGNGAMMSFHRGGQYAINMGLDSDNVLRIGGWSASANLFQMDMSGNLTMAANVTAYSDETLKKDWAPVQDGFVAKLAKVKSGTYTRIDSGERQAGVGAQSFQPLLPETVLTDNAGKLSVAYGNAAMVSAVELAKDNVELRARIEKLEALVAKLIEG